MLLRSRRAVSYVAELYVTCAAALTMPGLFNTTWSNEMELIVEPQTTQCLWILVWRIF